MISRSKQMHDIKELLRRAGHCIRARILKVKYKMHQSVRKLD